MQNIINFWFNLPNKIRFLIIGSVNAVVSFCFYSIFCIILGSSNYQLSLVLSWLISSIFSFTLQKYFVFQSRGNWFREYTKCCITWSLSYLLNVLFLEICVKYLILNIFISQIISTFMVAIFTYILFKNFAFKKYCNLKK